VGRKKEIRRGYEETRIAPKGKRRKTREAKETNSFLSVFQGMAQVKSYQIKRRDA